MLIEDEANLRFTIARSLRTAGHEVHEAASLPQANELLARHVFDAVLTDVNLGPDSGIDLVARLREEGFEGPIVIMTGYGSVESAVRAMKVGADDYLEKPVRLEELSLLLDRLLATHHDRRRLRLYERLERASLGGEMVVGTSEPWRKTLDLAERIARLPVANRGESGAGSALATILLLGETGVGKGLLARHIHSVGERVEGRSGTPFVHVNCSALPAALIESELFGHEKGAFTDARAAREGLFEMADGGTIFLDEIGDMPLELQAKLLTVLERGIVRRVGGVREIAVRVRVIAASNQDLQTSAADGRFRRDLLYRLNALTITIPPLRERGEDAAEIARAMLARFGREFGRNDLTLAPDALAAIRQHAWPGNVREVVNVMQRAAMLSESSSVTADDLGLMPALEAETDNTAGAGSLDAGPSPGPASAAPGIVFDFDAGRCTFTDVERELMKQALTRTRGNVSRAAKLIGMQRSSFRYRIDRYGLHEFVREVSQ